MNCSKIRESSHFVEKCSRYVEIIFIIKSLIIKIVEVVVSVEAIFSAKQPKLFSFYTQIKKGVNVPFTPSLQLIHESKFLFIFIILYIYIDVYAIHSLYLHIIKTKGLINIRSAFPFFTSY